MADTRSRMVALRDAIDRYHEIMARANATRILEAEQREQDLREPVRTSAWPRGGTLRRQGDPHCQCSADTA
jgi:hypothetical protein